MFFRWVELMDSYYDRIFRIPWWKKAKFKELAWDTFVIFSLSMLYYMVSMIERKKKWPIFCLIMLLILFFLYLFGMVKLFIWVSSVQLPFIVMRLFLYYYVFRFLSAGIIMFYFMLYKLKLMSDQWYYHSR